MLSIPCEYGAVINPIHPQPLKAVRDIVALHSPILANTYDMLASALPTVFITTIVTSLVQLAHAGHDTHYRPELSFPTQDTCAYVNATLQVPDHGTPVKIGPFGTHLALALYRCADTNLNFVVACLCLSDIPNILTRSGALSTGGIEDALQVAGSVATGKAITKLVCSSSQ